MWKKLNSEEIKSRVFNALKKNVDFEKSDIIGIPASYLDPKVFYQDAPFLKDAPYLTAMIQNPNHIGCHTLGDSERFFSGTQEIERELIEMCAVDILNGKPGEQDGYVASGGTEANIQAAWVYRNYFMREKKLSREHIALVCSADCHYSVAKAANLLGIGFAKVPVTADTRTISEQDVRTELSILKQNGVKAVIIVANMMTTMFGSVDDVHAYIAAVKSSGLDYKIHVDGAYGGFVYPFSGDDSDLDFSNPEVSSVVLDAHKMAQAPYGTGILLIRKGYMKYAMTEEASYVQGLDSTLIGSRSGANPIAVWMILSTYGPNGWREKIHMLMYRTQWMCQKLDELEISYYRHPRANIITIKSDQISEEIAQKYGLVPDNHASPSWYKIVVMDHVTIDKLEKLVEELKN